MPDRTINFGESETEATYQIQDTDGAAGGGNFVVAKDTDANTVLLEYDPASDTWEYAGDVDMNGGNVSGVGTLTADSVNTENLDHVGAYRDEAANRSFLTWYQNTTGSQINVVVAIEVTSNGTEIGLAPKVSASQSGGTVYGKNLFLDDGEDTIVYFTVPAGFYYRIDDFGDKGGFNISTWKEQ